MLYEAFCPSFYCMLITREIVFTKLKMLLDNSGTFLLLHRHVTANSISTAQTRRLGDVNNDDDRYLLISMVANLLWNVLFVAGSVQKSLKHHITVIMVLFPH